MLSLPSVLSANPDFSLDPRVSRTWAQVDLAALAGNIAELKRFAGVSGAVMAVAKADGYGHGAIAIARVCDAQGVRHIGVASVAEALELRGAGIGGEIYLLSAFLPEEAAAIVRADLTPFLSSFEQAEALMDAAESAPLPARAFLTVDTGMGREGCLPDVAQTLWRDVARRKSLCFSGIATHFSSADEDDWEPPTFAQQENFLAFLDALGPDALRQNEDGRGESGVFLSLCNSPATLRQSAVMTGGLRRTGVRGLLYRAGLSLYGIAPYREAQEAETAFRPLLSWRARITLIRDLPAGATLGYGRTHALTRPARIATVAAGYADGLSRRLSNRGSVLLQNRRFPIVGRISMDQCQIDVTDATEPVRVGDIITLIGSDGPETQTAFDLAEQTGAIPHEPTCALTNRVVRLY